MEKWAKLSRQRRYPCMFGKQYATNQSERDCAKCGRVESYIYSVDLTLLTRSCVNKYSVYNLSNSMLVITHSL